MCADVRNSTHFHMCEMCSMCIQIGFGNLCVIMSKNLIKKLQKCVQKCECANVHHIRVPTKCVAAGVSLQTHQLASSRTTC